MIKSALQMFTIVALSIITSSAYAKDCYDIYEQSDCSNHKACSWNLRTGNCERLPCEMYNQKGCTKPGCKWKKKGLLSKEFQCQGMIDFNALFNTEDKKS